MGTQLWPTFHKILPGKAAAIILRNNLFAKFLSTLPSHCWFLQALFCINSEIHFFNIFTTLYYESQ